MLGHIGLLDLWVYYGEMNQRLEVCFTVCGYFDWVWLDALYDNQRVEVCWSFLFWTEAGLDRCPWDGDQRICELCLDNRSSWFSFFVSQVKFIWQHLWYGLLVLQLLDLMGLSGGAMFCFTLLHAVSSVDLIFPDLLWTLSSYGDKIWTFRLIWWIDKIWRLLWSTTNRKTQCSLFSSPEETCVVSIALFLWHWLWFFLLPFCGCRLFSPRHVGSHSNMLPFWFVILSVVYFIICTPYPCVPVGLLPAWLAVCSIRWNCGCALYVESG